MSEEELYTLLTSISGFSNKVAYDHFTEPNITPPFILYRNTDSTTIKADDKVALRENEYIVDLITILKDSALEKTLEALFNDNYIPFDKEEDFIESEKIYQIRYFIRRTNIWQTKCCMALEMLFVQ